MTTTPEDPEARPDQNDEAARPADETQPVPPAKAVQPVPSAEVTQPVAPVDATQPVAPVFPADAAQPVAPVFPADAAQPVAPVDATASAPVAPPASAAPPAPPAPHPSAGSSYPYGGPANAQPYTGPANPQPYPQPYTGPAYPAQPYPPQPYPGPYAPRPAAPQPYGGPAYAPRTAAATPYPAAQAGAPVSPAGAPMAQAPVPPGAGAGQAGPGGPAGVGPAGPAGTGPGGPAGPGATAPKKRGWLPVVATLVVVAMLAAAAIVIGTHRFRSGAPDTASSPSSMATIGQSDAGTIPVAGSTSENPNWAAVAAAVQASVVSIQVQTSGGEALGSGVVVDSEGHVVTNNHVVEGVQGDTVQVTLSDGRIYDAVVAGTDSSTDLAVVTIQDPPSDLAIAQFGESSQVAVGDPVMAVGNPLGLANTVTTGIVSAVDRPVSPRTDGTTEGPVTNAIQIDAAINPGNSGGPLFDAQGRVIGITSSIATTSSDSGSIGLGFAIPVDLVKNIAAQLIDKGEAEHAYLGVTLRDGTATADGVTRRGAEVGEVSSDSPASAAGIQAGDVVVAINDKPVGGADSLAAYVRAMAAGEKATLLVVRDGSSQTIEATLTTRPDSTSSAPPTDQNQNGSGDSGSGNELPGGMTPQELWNWLQEHQGQLGNGQGNGQG